MREATTNERARTWTALVFMGTRSVLRGQCSAAAAARAMNRQGMGGWWKMLPDGKERGILPSLCAPVHQPSRRCLTQACRQGGGSEVAVWPAGLFFTMQLLECEQVAVHCPGGQMGKSGRQPRRNCHVAR